jgi:hypothetical protein
MSKIVTISTVLCLLFISVYADNPVVQTCYTADPAPMAYNGRVYLYVGHDSSAAPSNSYLMRYWKCYSSSDMVNWTDHGPVLYAKQFSWSGGDANAAQVIERDKKFYYYISTGGPGGIAIGVGVADSPLGPFKDALGKPLITNSQTTYASHAWDDLDPTVFIDDNGQAYLFWGNNACYWVKLNSDMISTSGSISALDIKSTAAFGPDFEEAPWVYKKGSIYYLVYASGFPESIRYSTSASPSGPWSYKGQIMAVQPNGISNTIHPGVVDFEGNSYYFYHNAVLPGGHSYKRSVCIEQFKYNTDGTIPAIKETSGGVTTGVKSLNPYDTVQAETICFSSGLHTSSCSDGGIQVDSIHNGDYIKVKGVDFGSSGATSFTARVASASSGGSIELRLGSLTGTLIGTCAVGGTGGWQTWTTKTCTLNGATGTQDLFMKFTGSSGSLFNFNWWKCTPQGTSIKRSVSDASEDQIRLVCNPDGNLSLNCSFTGNITDEIVSEIFDLRGRNILTLHSGSITERNVVIPINYNRFQSGSYLIRILKGNKIIFYKTITVK